LIRNTKLAKITKKQKKIIEENSKQQQKKCIFQQKVSNKITAPYGMVTTFYKTLNMNLMADIY